MKRYIKLNRDGRATIPKELRQRLGIKKGTHLSIKANDDSIVLRPIDALIESLRGCFKGGPSLSDLREREHRDDRE